MNVRLPLRLFISYALVVALGAAVAYVTVRLLAPHLFYQQMTMLNGVQPGQNMMSGSVQLNSSVRNAFLSALTQALLLGLLVSMAAAGIAAAFVTHRLLRPLNAVRAATRPSPQATTRPACRNPEHPSWPPSPPTSTRWQPRSPPPKPGGPGCSGRSRMRCAPR